MNVVVLGLSITSSWGNGHATNYRALLAALRRRGHPALFLERDVPWYDASRDAPGAGELYRSLDDLARRFEGDVREADLVVVGSYVPEGVAAASWALETARGPVCFYDIDTPVTLAKLAAGDEEYLTPELVPRFGAYLSFTGGPMLRALEERWGARRAVAFHCLVDPEAYRPVAAPRRWLLGFLGTYSPDRQPKLERLLLGVARALPRERFVVAGPQYPDTIDWPPNVERIEHLPPGDHPRFYAAQAFTLNLTRADMAEAGWSPSVRLFEAAACGTPAISDAWPGLERFFVPGREILTAETEQQVVDLLTQTSEKAHRALGAAARKRVLTAHTADHRVRALERLAAELAPVAR